VHFLIRASVSLDDASRAEPPLRVMRVRQP
jgi:hypothetical protein